MGPRPPTFEGPREEPRVTLQNRGLCRTQGFFIGFSGGPLGAPTPHQARSTTASVLHGRGPLRSRTAATLKGSLLLPLLPLQPPLQLPLAVPLLLLQQPLPLLPLQEQLLLGLVAVWECAAAAAGRISRCPDVLFRLQNDGGSSVCCCGCCLVAFVGRP